MKFGDKLKEQRGKRGLTQSEIADAIGVSTRTILYYEKGQTYPQSRLIYDKLADYFGVDINYFLTQDEQFLTEAAEKYGRRGRSQAEAILEQATALFAGGELDEDDKLAFVHEIQGLYLDSKERAKRFAPKKHM
jgi:transcriptional regulator with XRE-family HTH domain